MPVNPRLRAYFEDYQAYHRTPGNRACHFLGVPLITVSVLGLLGTLAIGPSGLFGSPLLRFDCGTLLWGLALLWYVTLDVRMALSFSSVALGAYFMGRAIAVPALWGLFAIGWILQLIGHSRFERKSPAFLRNARHLLVGPLWVFAKVVGWTEGDGLGTDREVPAPGRAQDPPNADTRE